MSDKSQRIEHSTQFLKGLIDAIDDPLFVKDRNHKWVFLNDACCRFWKYDKKTLIGKSDFDFFPKEQAAIYWRKDDEVFKRKNSDLNVEMQTIEGEIHIISTKKSYFKDPQTGNEYIVGTIRDITEQERAHEKLRESEETFRNLAESSPNMIFINKDGKVVYVSEKCCEVLGYSREEFLSPDFDFMSLISLEYKNKVKAAFEKHMRGEEVPPYEYALITKDGRKASTIITTKLINFRGGNAILGVVTDISEQKMAEEKLTNSEVLYRTTINALGDFIHMVDRDLKIILCNDAIKSLNRKLGLKTEVEGENLSEIYPFLSTTVFHEYEEVFNSGKILITEENTRVNGRDYFMETKKIPVIEDEKVTRIVTVMHDITQNKRVQKALKESEVQYRTLFDSINDAIFIRDLEGNFIEVNKQAVKQLGYSKDELLRMTPADLIAPSFSHQKEEFRDPELLKKQRIFETAHVCKGGSIIPAEISSRLIEYRGEPAVLAVSRDITKRKEAENSLRESEEKLLQSQKMEAIGRLAGGIAHDFNNLLTAILGYCEILEIHNRLDEKERRFVSEIKRSGERATMLTRRLLAFSRKQVLHPRPLNLNTLLSGIEEMLKRIIGEDIQLVTKPQPELGNIMADPGQIEQVLINLVVNAREAMPKGGIITIGTGNERIDECYCHFGHLVKAGEYIFFTVADTGSGIESKISKLIFEPFFTTKEKDKGTGLGLSMVYGVITQSQGHIFLKSNSGQGTTFKLLFPRIFIGENKNIQKEKEEKPQRGTETLLVVEDEDIVKKMITTTLTGLGYRVYDAQDGYEAISVCKKSEQIDMLITDVVMPGMSGIELADNLQSRYKDMKVLFISGYTDDAIGQHGVLDEEISFLQKPFTPQKLAKKIRIMFDSDNGQKT